MNPKVKKVIKPLAKRLTGSRDNEPIHDTLRRHQVNMFRCIDPVRYSAEMLKQALMSLGIESGDTLVVHCQWRSLYGFDGSPHSFIQLLKELVGECGTIMMPSYGYDARRISVSETPSITGVLSETFRKDPEVTRVAVPVFSMSCWGEDTAYYLRRSLECRYGFDEFSPYGSAIDRHAKVLLVGMGKNSDKISAFHYSVWKHRSINPYDNIWMPFRWTCEYEDGSVREVSAIGKIGNVRNDRLMFKRVFRKVEKRISSFGFMDLVLFDAQSAVDICSERIGRGAKLYKTK